MTPIEIKVIIIPQTNAQGEKGIGVSIQNNIKEAAHQFTPPSGSELSKTPGKRFKPTQE